MSTTYRIINKRFDAVDVEDRFICIPVADLFDGRLEAYGVRETSLDGLRSHDGEAWRCVTDSPVGEENGPNNLFFKDDGKVGLLKRWGASNPSRILDAIEEAFGVEIVVVDPSEEGGHRPRVRPTAAK